MSVTMSLSVWWVTGPQLGGRSRLEAQCKGHVLWVGSNGVMAKTRQMPFTSLAVGDQWHYFNFYVKTK